MHSKRINGLLKEVLAGVAVLAFSTLMDFENSPGFEIIGIVPHIIKYASIPISAVIFLLALILLISRKYNPSKIAMAILVFYAYLSVVTVANGYTLLKRGLIGNFAFVILFDILLLSEDIYMFRGVFNTLNILTILNFVSIILAPPGGFLTYNSYFHSYGGGHYLLGYDNGQIIMLLPTICFNLMRYIRKRNTINLIIAFLCVASIFIFFSATSVVAIILTAIIYISCKRLKLIRKVVTKKEVIILGILLLYATYILTNEFQFLSSIFMTLFNKDTLSVGRGRVVNIGISYIQEQWLTGYGYVVDDHWIGGYNSPHNLLLDILLAGGVIGLILFIRIFGKVFFYSNEYIHREKECMLLFASIVGILITSITEGYDTYTSFCLFWSICLSLGNWEECNSLLNKL